MFLFIYLLFLIFYNFMIIIISKTLGISFKLFMKTSEPVHKSS